jgi:hypothetical protein
VIVIRAQRQNKNHANFSRVARKAQRAHSPQPTVNNFVAVTNLPSDLEHEGCAFSLSVVGISAPAERVFELQVATTTLTFGYLDTKRVNK